MKIKRFYAKDTRTAMKDIRSEFGSDAVILSNKSVIGGVEIMAAMDFDQSKILSHKKSKTNQAQAAATTTLTKTADWIADPHLVNIQDELASLRELVKIKFQIDHQQKNIYSDPQRFQYMRLMQQCGFSLPIIKSLMAGPLVLDSAQAFWQSLEQVLGARLKTKSDTVIDTGGVIALIGPTGSGKTTTLAKIAATYALKYGASNVGIISTDDYRIGAHEQCQSYGRLMDIEVICTDKSISLDVALHRFRDKKLTLIDTSGIGLNDCNIKDRLAGVYQSNVRISHLLMLPANIEHAALSKSIKQYGSERLKSVVITKLDEASNLCPIVDSLLSHECDIELLTNGQKVPEDIKLSSASTIAELTVSLAKTIKIDTLDEPSAFASLEEYQHA